MVDIPEKGFHFEPSTHTYTWNGKRMTGVTTILGVIAKPALIAWASNQAVDYIEHHSISDEETGIFIKSADLEEARTAYAKKRDKAGEAGILFLVYQPLHLEQVKFMLSLTPHNQ